MTWLRPRTERRLAGAACAAALVSVCLATPAGAHEPYDDSDANLFKVLYYVVYPAAKLSEWLVVRPLHFVGSRFAPEPGEGRGEHCGAYGRRPRRDCTLGPG